MTSLLSRSILLPLLLAALFFGLTPPAHAELPATGSIAKAQGEPLDVDGDPTAGNRAGEPESPDDVSNGDGARGDGTRGGGGSRGGFGKGSPGEMLVTILVFGLLGVVFGVGLGAFGLGADQVFRGRSAMTLRIMRGRPILSLVAGSVVTIVGLGLMSILEAYQGLVLLILILYFVALVTCAAAACVRLAAQWIEPGLTADDSPSASAFVRGGLILVATNAVLVLGSAFFFGLLLCGVGATLLSYFVSIGGAAASVAATDT